MLNATARGRGDIDMLWPIRWLVWAIMRVILACRYRVRVLGKPEVFKKPGPYLILPNHPAYADPPNLLVHLWPPFKMRPLLLETNFNNPVLAPFKWLLLAINMPDITRASAVDRQRAETAVGEVIAALRQGENVILWPSGRLSRDGTERLGGARAAADILAAVPEATAVLARTRGLRGSMFSWADGKPELLRGILKAFGLWFANLILFAPRRRVTVTLEPFTRDERPRSEERRVGKECRSG